MGGGEFLTLPRVMYCLPFHAKDLSDTWEVQTYYVGMQHNPVSIKVAPRKKHEIHTYENYSPIFYPSRTVSNTTLSEPSACSSGFIGTNGRWYSPPSVTVIFGLLLGNSRTLPTIPVANVHSRR